MSRKKMTEKKLSKTAHELIVELSSRGYSHKSLAKLFGVDVRQIEFHLSKRYKGYDVGVDWSKINTGLGNIEHRYPTVFDEDPDYE